MQPNMIQLFLIFKSEKTKFENVTGCSEIFCLLHQTARYCPNIGSYLGTQDLSNRN